VTLLTQTIDHIENVSIVDAELEESERQTAECLREAAGVLTEVGGLPQAAGDDNADNKIVDAVEADADAGANGMQATLDWLVGSSVSIGNSIYSWTIGYLVGQEESN
jgi:hypothetical protein